MKSTASDDAASVAAAYHRGWTSGHFDDAMELLAPDIKVEVPINEYPTREAFARAVVDFGSMVERADTLAEFASGNEAMLLYDMHVKGLGIIRIAEHFTVSDGKIVRLRQIHDTAPIQAARLGRNT